IMRYGEVRVEFDRVPKLSIANWEIRRRERNVDLSEGGVGFGQLIVQLEGFAGGFFRFAPAFDWCDRAIVSEIGVRIRQTGIGERILPVFLERSFEKTNRRK